METPRPKILNPVSDRTEIKKLRNNRCVHVVDTFDEQLKELFLVRHPKLRLNPREASIQVTKFLQLQQAKPLEEQGKWMYFQWNNTLVHILDEPDFFELRTSRNHNLITSKEQAVLQNFRVGIAGLSVGNSAALTLALEGFETMRLADFDELSISNLNRIRSSITQLNINKTIITARQIYELNPYAKLELFTRGLKDEKTLKNFIAGPPKLRLLIDEIDDVIMKMRLRVFARKLHIPVISAADNGDNALVDVERFDVEPTRPIFHGALEKVDSQMLKAETFGEKIKLINTMVGVEYVTSRMKQSLLQVGDTLYAWPQLGGAAILSGAALAYLAKKIAFKEELRSGKYDINFDRIFDSQYDLPIKKQRREKETKDFLANMNINFLLPYNE